jgi:phosphoglycolate phosphatase
MVETRQDRRYKALIFDFDYTLADSSAGAIECVNFSLEKLGLPAADAEAIKRTIGLSLERTLRQLVPEVPDGAVSEFERLFLQRAAEVIVERSVMLKGVPQVLRHLQEDGWRLAIASTKWRARIEGILAKYELSGLFEVIVGGDEVVEYKPDPEVLYEAVRRLGLAVGDILYVGDSLSDAEAAQRAPADFVAVLSGTTPAADFAPYEAVAVLDDLAALPALLHKD